MRETARENIENTNPSKPPASSRLVELGGFEPPTFCLPASRGVESDTGHPAQAKDPQVNLAPSLAQSSPSINIGPTAASVSHPQDCSSTLRLQATAPAVVSSSSPARTTRATSISSRGQVYRRNSC